MEREFHRGPHRVSGARFTGWTGGRAGEVASATEQLHAKALKDLKPDDVVHVNLPGGGGYGDPFQRDPQRFSGMLLKDMLARKRRKMLWCSARLPGKAEDLVKLPGDWLIDHQRDGGIAPESRMTQIQALRRAEI